ncbi:MAG TPA: transcription elongation factor GreA, partial [Myxococcales bacterium]|nr:transcription elongation factor GreA [Myxococcales bacterium]
MADRVPMTRKGYESLKRELDRLKTVERPENVRDIEEAIAHGDLSENAEYHAAKEQQSHIVGRIASTEDKLARAQIIETPSGPSEKVQF